MASKKPYKPDYKDFPEVLQLLKDTYHWIADDHEMNQAAVNWEIYRGAMLKAMKKYVVSR